MKMTCRDTILVFSAVLISIVMNVKSVSAKEEPKEYKTERIIENTPADLPTYQQLKAQVDFFKQALDEFGATNPEQVINLWIKARKTRNGVFMYSVLCKNLKYEVIKKWGDPEEGFWIIGGSSPWVEKYEITKKKLSENTYGASIKFYWATSAGPEEPTIDELVIVKVGDKWCVKKAKGLFYYT